jgi:hypothetical protein
MKKTILALLSMPLLFIACKNNDDDTVETGRDPNTAAKVAVDRFSATAGHLMIRTATNGLPAANAPVNFDQGPFITKGLGPAGQTVDYYNFDVQPTRPIPIYVFFKSGATTPVPGQLNVIDAIPGDAGYNDFWLVNKVIVPDNFVVNTVSSYQDIVNKGYTIQTTNSVVNCPVVPEGSTASKRLGGGSAALIRCWYKNQVVFYFDFSEKAITTTPGGMVPLSPIYVCFNINPADPGGGPGSGFKTEASNMKTHNVVATVPADAGYSPLWTVNVYNNSSFNSVTNLSTAVAAPNVGSNVATVNCPVVAIQ